MIVFKLLRYKNFLSTGNSWTEVDLNQHRTTLVIGDNGSGKSTMLDALSFTLFGKPHRNINKHQLVNSINNKDCEVEVTFSVGMNEFKVSRGIKPAKFEILKNDVLINQNSHAKEYQKILEQNIIKLNHKSFHQIVVLGSSSFIPFMQLPGGHRRDVIEDLLDINVFSKMNHLLKEKTAIVKNKLQDIKYNIEILDNKIKTQSKYIKDVKILTESNVASKQSTITTNQSEIITLQEVNISLSGEVDGKNDEVQKSLKKYHDKKQALLQYGGQFKTQTNQITKEAKFYENNEDCPTCSQNISSELRETKLAASRSKAKELQIAMGKLATQQADIEQNIEHAGIALEELREKQSTLHSNNTEIDRLQKQIRSIEKELSSTVVADLDEARLELDAMETDKNTYREERLKQNEQYSINSAMSEMLKDTGIKTKIIKEYLPVINNLVNQYLQVLDFFVHFNLDESFQETIRSRHRDAFSYDSFSEGEKQRIDLSLLFTWRMIAKMKNSVATNLLLLDETFDSSLDHEGVENLMKILNTLEEDTNVFVISHKGEILDGKFENKIEFVKEKNFSKLAK